MILDFKFGKCVSPIQRVYIRKRNYMEELLNDEFYNQFVKLFTDAKKKLTTAVNMTMVYSYYEAGRMIVEKINRDANVITSEVFLNFIIITILSFNMLFLMKLFAKILLSFCQSAIFTSVLAYISLLSSCKI